MGNTLDYLDWRGDLTFLQAPFNEVDNYILSKFGCPDFTGIIPENGCIRLCDAVAQYEASLGDMDPDEALGPLASPLIMPVIRRLPHTARFRDLIVCDFVNRLDPVREEQFSALTIILPDGTRFVTFRGTGDTIVSWKEDFLLSVEDEVPAQADAVAYLLKQSRCDDCRLMIGGHSKGGNLSVYAAMKAPPEIQARITAVYNNDGPGFRRDPSDDEGYRRIKPVLHTLVSQHTTIGKLLHHETDCIIVKTEDGGTAAHDGFNWEILGAQYVRCEDFSITSKAFEVAVRETIESLGSEGMRDFIEEFFGILTSTGADTLSDLTEHRLRQAAGLGSSMYKSPEVRNFLIKLVTIFFSEAVSNAWDSLPHRRRDEEGEMPAAPEDEDDEQGLIREFIERVRREIAEREEEKAAKDAAADDDEPGAIRELLGRVRRDIAERREERQEEKSEDESQS